MYVATVMHHHILSDEASEFNIKSQVKSSRQAKHNESKLKIVRRNRIRLG